MKPLTIEDLLREANSFAACLGGEDVPGLYGTTDGKTVGTHVETEFKSRLSRNYTFDAGNVATGIDFPDLLVDVKATSIARPQSSTPFTSAQQKVFGLGYHLLVFVYEKADDDSGKTSRLNIARTIFIEKELTADYQTTVGINEILDRGGNRDDLLAFFEDRNLPVDDISAGRIADSVLERRPVVGCLTISNALQWRLLYGRALENADGVPGIRRVS